MSDEEGKRLGPIFDEFLIEYQEKAAFYHAECSGLLRLMLASLYRKPPHVPQTAHIERSGDRLVARLRVLIEATYRQNRMIAEYARDLAVSERHLIRVCQQFSERSPMRMVLQRRLTESMRLPRFTSLPADQIAYELGFHDNAHFSRFFKAKIGSSPIAWRRHQDRAQ